MKTIQILGSGCASCKSTYQLIEERARARGVQVNLEKVEDIAEIMRHGVMSTPGVVIDGQVVHTGGIPSRDTVDAWLAGETPSSSGPRGSGGCCGN
ncbi:MAG: thioredoxin family protein [Ectothiorhodospira sp.]